MAKIPDITVKVDVIEVSALQQLAEEFRRLAAEAKERGLQADGNYQLQRGKRLAFEQAAQMLEEKLQPGYELKVEGEGINATVEYVDEDPLRWLP